MPELPPASPCPATARAIGRYLAPLPCSPACAVFFSGRWPLAPERPPSGRPKELVFLVIKRSHRTIVRALARANLSSFSSKAEWLRSPNPDARRPSLARARPSTAEGKPHGSAVDRSGVGAAPRAHARGSLRRAPSRAGAAHGAAWTASARALRAPLRRPARSFSRRLLSATERALDTSEPARRIAARERESGAAAYTHRSAPRTSRSRSITGSMPRDGTARVYSIAPGPRLRIVRVNATACAS
jgi:hypothetical protein